jgi:nitroreductase
MEFYEVIKTRQSIRSYNPSKAIDESVLKRVLNAGRLAPSAANRQPYYFLVIKSPDVLNKIKECYEQSWFKDAPCILAMVGKYNEAWTRKYDNYNPLETDLAIAMDHIILAATSEGLGTCWIAAFDPMILRKVLNLNENERVFTITPLGYPRTDFIRDAEKNRKALEDMVKIL